MNDVLSLANWPDRLTEAGAFVLGLAPLVALFLGMWLVAAMGAFAVSMFRRGAGNVRGVGGGAVASSSAGMGSSIVSAKRKSSRRGKRATVSSVPSGGGAAGGSSDSD